MTVFLAVIVVVLAGLWAYVRFASVDVSVWHVDLQKARPSEMDRAVVTSGASLVQPLVGGAYADLSTSVDEAVKILTKLDKIALETPRTRRIAGSVDAGHITWETRSSLWGFPDYTTAQITEGGVTIFARLRFGKSDLGVNAKRLSDWLSKP